MQEQAPIFAIGEPGASAPGGRHGRRRLGASAPGQEVSQETSDLPGLKSGLAKLVSACGLRHAACAEAAAPVEKQVFVLVLAFVLVLGSLFSAAALRTGTSASRRIRLPEGMAAFG